MKFKFPFRSSRRSFNLTDTPSPHSFYETAIDQVGQVPNAPRPSFRTLVDTRADSNTSNSSFDSSSEVPPPLPRSAPPFSNGTVASDTSEQGRKPLNYTSSFPVQEVDENQTITVKEEEEEEGEADSKFDSKKLNLHTDLANDTHTCIEVSAVSKEAEAITPNCSFPESSPALEELSNLIVKIVGSSPTTEKGKILLSKVDSEQAHTTTEDFIVEKSNKVKEVENNIKNTVFEAKLSDSATTEPSQSISKVVEGSSTQAEDGVKDLHRDQVTLETSNVDKDKMGCVTSQPNEETGETDLSCKDGKTTILIPTSQVSLRLSACKEEKKAQNGEQCEHHRNHYGDLKNDNTFDEIGKKANIILEEPENVQEQVEEIDPDKEGIDGADQRIVEIKCDQRSDETVYEEIQDPEKKIDVSEESDNVMVPNKKKEGVSAESSGTKIGSAKEIKIVRYEKDLASRELIKKALQENQFMKFGLDSEGVVNAVVDAMYLKNLPSGSYVIREGEPGSELYVCAKGSFDVFKGTVKVNTLGPGTLFGELAVLYHTKRNATIVATSNCSLWVLDRRAFHKIMMKDGMERQEENIKFLRSVPLLRNLDKPSLIKMSDLLRVEYFDRDTPIVKQGDEGSKFYIISLGEVKVTVANPGCEEEEVARLSKGAFFGERALLNDDVRKATVTALEGGTECLVLDRQPFMELLGSIDILLQAAGKTTTEASTTETKLVSEYENVKLSELSTVGTLGVGGFGRVELVKCRGGHHSNSLFALKCIKKVVIIEQQQQEHIFNEKAIMLACRSPFIARLYKTYHDKKFLYLLMEACMGGDVWTLLQRHRLFDEPTARFMVACVVEGLEYLHTRGIVYRDLKPENMMLDATGYIKLVDFGFAKKIGASNKTWTFAGTPEYLAPEIVRNKGHDRAADYWSLGIFIHELLAGKPPFRGHDHHKTYNLILKGIDYVAFPSFIQKTAALLIRRLCRQLPTERLGYQKDGIKDIKNHRWFFGFDWESLRSTTMPAPIVPRLRFPEDLSNFEKYPKDKEIPPDETSGWDIDF